jgi:plasmid stabilization system protein ParE
LTVRIAPRARRELTARVAYIARDNPVAARRFAERVFALINDLARGGFDGPEQTLRTGEVVRSWPLPPMRIYYQRAPDGLIVLRIYHQARSPITR